MSDEHEAAYAQGYADAEAQYAGDYTKGYEHGAQCRLSSMLGRTYINVRESFTLRYDGPMRRWVVVQDGREVLL